METRRLSPVGIFKGPVNTEFQLYYIVGEDEAGARYLIPFGTRHNYIESVNKAIAKLNPIDLIVGEENEQSETQPAEN